MPVIEKLSGKNLFFGDGVPKGQAMLLAECGRVMAVAELDDLPDDLLRLVDTVCLNEADRARIAAPET